MLLLLLVCRELAGELLYFKQDTFTHVRGDSVGDLAHFALVNLVQLALALREKALKVLFQVELFLLIVEGRIVF